MRTWLHDLWLDESGTSLIEYGMCVCLIALTLIGVLTTFSERVNAPIETLAGTIH